MNRKKLIAIALKSAIAVSTLLLLNMGALTPLIIVSTAREVVSK